MAIITYRNKEYLFCLYRTVLSRKEHKFLRKPHFSTMQQFAFFQVSPPPWICAGRAACSNRSATAAPNFKLICIFYDFKAPLLENRWFSDFKTCIIGFGMKNCFRNISSFLDLNYFEKNQNYDNYGNFDVFKIIQL